MVALELNANDNHWHFRHKFCQKIGPDNTYRHHGTSSIETSMGVRLGPPAFEPKNATQGST